jgi:LacI family transcriptional regulator
MRTKYTIGDIARELGLSRATISMALSGSPGVNEDTRERVRSYARRIGYRPSAVARAITTGRTYLVACVLNCLTDSFFQEIAQGIENVANLYGYDVIIHTRGPRTQSESEVIERLISRHLDGLIATYSSLSDAAIARLRSVDIPVLMLLPEVFGELPCVVVDNFQGGQMAAQHLLELGHRQFLFVGYDDIYSQRRAEGADQCLAVSSSEKMDRITIHRSTDYESVSAMLKERREITAVFCANDVIAIDLCKLLKTHGLSVPDDISVVGFDNIPSAWHATPALTTIQQPQKSQGEAAMLALIELMNGASTANNVKLQPQLIARESTGPAQIHPRYTP